MATISKKAQQLIDSQAERARVRAERQRAQEEKEIDDLIAETGWAVCTADAGDAPGNPAPHFGYTIGRSLKGQPELCMWGHHRDEIAPTLNVLAALIDADGHTPQDGDVLTVAGVGRWRVLRVPTEVLDHLSYARRRYTFIRAVRLRRIL